MVRPCALDVVPLRYPTRAGKKRCASGLQGPRGAKGASVGERRWLPDGVGLTLATPLPLLYRHPPISLESRVQLETLSLV